MFTSQKTERTNETNQDQDRVQKIKEHIVKNCMKQNRDDTHYMSIGKDGDNEEIQGYLSKGNYQRWRTCNWAETNGEWGDALKLMQDAPDFKKFQQEMVTKDYKKQPWQKNAIHPSEQQMPPKRYVHKLGQSSQTLFAAELENSQLPQSHNGSRKRKWQTPSTDTLQTPPKIFMNNRRQVSQRVHISPSHARVSWSSSK